jgi:two-component sensor histidine kinase/HAMP domain-containing protein
MHLRDVTEDENRASLPRPPLQTRNLTWSIDEVTSLHSQRQKGLFFGSKKMFKKTKITTMFLAWFLIIALLPLVFYGYTSSRKTIKTLKSEVMNTLISITDNKARQIMTYFLEREKDVTTLASSPTIMNALKKFKIAFEKGKIVSPYYGLVSLNYNSIEREFGQFFTYYKESVGYYNLFLISPEGDVVFTVTKEDDLGTNLVIGPYKDSELAKVFERAKTLLETNMSDYKYYSPSSEPAAFIAAPVLSEGRLIGVVALQVDNDEISAIVNDYTGLGETGETIVASREGDEAVFVMPIRHDLHAAFRNKILIGSEELLSIQKAIKGQKGYGMSFDYRGKETLAVWRYLPHLRWGMVVKIDAEEAFAPVANLKNWSFFIGVITIFGVILAAFLVSGSISNPIINLTRTTRRIAGGDLTSKVDIKGSVEICELGASFNKMMEQLESSRRELTEHRDHLKELVDERTKDLRESEKQIKASLEGKEVLLKEIHHRVKNNLQVVSSLIMLQTENMKDERYIEMFNECQNRIKTMALIHDKLYRSKDIAKIELNDYIKSLVTETFRSYRKSTTKVKLKLDLEEIIIEIETAISCGLIINELISNSLKYAFPEDREGEIKISIRLLGKDEFEMIFSDNGIGIPEDIDYRNTKSLGLRLIVNLSERQLVGKIELDRSKGTKFQIRFKEVKHKKRV